MSPVPETDVVAQLCPNNVDLPVFVATSGLRQRYGGCWSLTITWW